MSCMPRPARAVVCVPARDEADRLPALLRSLAVQDGHAPPGRLGVVVVANNCTDGTAALARALGAAPEGAGLDLRVVEARFAPAEAHVGSARRLALDTGAAWLAEQGSPNGALLTTDADATVPPDWVGANLRALERADIVGGRLVIEPGAPIDPALSLLNGRIERYWAAVRALEDRLDPPPHDPAPRHGDHTGASLALRAGLYRAVGGLPALARGEDNALVARVEAQGGRLRHCPAVTVAVSDRAAGRVTGGMATEMGRRARVVSGEEAYRLPAPEHWRAATARRAALRDLWFSTDDAAARWRGLSAFGLDEADVAAIAPETCANDIAFVTRASRRLDLRAGEAETIDLDTALAAFDRLLRGLGSPGHAA